MGAMEKKRLLPALIAAALAVSGMGTALAEDTASLRSVRTEPGEAELSRARELLGKLKEPDMAEAEKTLSEIKRNSPAEGEPGEIMELLSVKPGPGAVFPEKNAATQKEKPELFYFFSFSMPHPSLRRRRARESASRRRGDGSSGSFRGATLGETASRISEVIGRTGAQVWIDPPLFRMLLGRGGAAACACLRPLAGSGLRGAPPRKGFWRHITSLRPRDHGKGGRKCRGIYQTPCGKRLL